MSWIQITLAIPAALLAAALVHDFFAGLGEERQWSDPAVNDPDSFPCQATAAELTHKQENPILREAPRETRSWERVLAPLPH
jgi:hypothetical protein